MTGPLTVLTYELQFSDAIADQTKKLIKAEQKKLEKKLESELLGTVAPSAPSGNSDAEPDTPTAKPEDALRRQLKKLLR